jgi:MOB kinase activator 1
MGSFRSAVLPRLAQPCLRDQSECPVFSFEDAIYIHSLDYTWIDSNHRQVKLPAPTYIDYVVTWIQKTLDDETVFPTKAG